MYRRRTLGDICDEADGIIRTGPFGSQLHRSDYADEGIPVVMPKDISGGRVATDDIARITEETACRLGQYRLAVGDIVYGRRGDIGRRALITERERGWLCGTGCLRISLGDSIIDPGYLYYYLDQPEVISWIFNQAVGATMPNLNTSILRSVEVTFPTLSSQRRIASILSAYDDLIENNTRRIAILEEMAQSLYREWFVHFRYPGHEHVPLIDSPLGQVPEGWEVCKLGDVIELAYGKALKADARVEGLIPVYGSSGVVGSHNQALVSGPGIIVGRKGNVGSVRYTAIDFYPIDTVFYVVTDLPLLYVFFALKQIQFIDSDVAVPGLNRSQAYLTPLLIPCARVLDEFTANALPLIDQTRVLRDKNAVLRRTRDLLLPKLIAGEVGTQPNDGMEPGHVG